MVESQPEVRAPSYGFLALQFNLLLVTEECLPEGRFSILSEWSHLQEVF